MNTPALTLNSPRRYHASVAETAFKSFLPTEVRPIDTRKMLVHEIRNPLANINLATELLKDMVNDEDQRRYLDIIARNSARITTLVADLLTHPNSNHLRLEKHSIHRLLEEILVTNQDRFMLGNVVIKRNYTVQDFRFKMNRPKVKIALENIIINAIESMHGNSGLLEITTKRLNGVCLIIIKDNGSGVSKENLDTIFKPFFTNKVGGMGVGLPVTLAILKANHIGINVRSEPGKGTRFILSYNRD